MNNGRQPLHVLEACSTLWFMPLVVLEAILDLSVAASTHLVNFCSFQCGNNISSLLSGYLFKKSILKHRGKKCADYTFTLQNNLLISVEELLFIFQIVFCMI